MPPRPMRVLTIILLLAAAFPPPQVGTMLIAETSRDRPAEAGKLPQARGRNRISAPAHPDACRAVSPLGSGGDRPTPPRRSLPHRGESPPILARVTSPPLLRSAALRLRC
jgi:hypothetical protein